MSFEQKLAELDGELARYVGFFSTASTPQKIQALKIVADRAGRKAAKYQSLRASIEREVKQLKKQLRQQEVQNG